MVFLKLKKGVDDLIIYTNGTVPKETVGVFILKLFKNSGAGFGNPKYKKLSLEEFNKTFEIIK